MLQKALTRHDLFVLLSFSEVFRTMLLKIYLYKKKNPNPDLSRIFSQPEFLPQSGNSGGEIVDETLWCCSYFGTQ